jgi:hypothetical protein
MSYALSTTGKASLTAMLSIMLFGIAAGQFVSYKILSMPPLSIQLGRPVIAGYASLVLMFGTFTFLPPKVVLFENYYCYQYTGEYGILSDYEPYRVFTRNQNGQDSAGGGVNYCANQRKVNNQIAQGY